MGWKLGQVPHLLSIYSKTRPSLTARLDETIYAAHPTRLEDLKWIEQVTVEGHNHCNVCGVTNAAFEGEVSYPTCRTCRSTPADRTVYRWLTGSILLNRRLPAVAVGIPQGLAEIWSTQFQGQIYSLEQLSSMFASAGSFSSADGSLHLALVRGWSLNYSRVLFDELARVLRPGGTLLLQVSDNWKGFHANSTAVVEKTVVTKFQLAEEVRYHSSALRFDWRKMQVLLRLPD